MESETGVQIDDAREMLVFESKTGPNRFYASGTIPVPNISL